jgi:hypothetical protein
MIKQDRLFSLILLLTAGLILAACGSLPAGADVSLNRDGKSADVVFSGTVDSISTLESGSNQTGLSRSSSSPSTASRPSSGSSVVSLSGISSSGSTGQVEYTGVVETITPDFWVVSGLTFGVTPQTEIKDTIVVGDTVKVEALINADSTFTAIEIKLDNPGPASGEIQLTGTVESIAADQWIISGVIFTVTADTEIKGTIIVGDLVQVEGLTNPDGTFTAREIKPADESNNDDEDINNNDDEDVNNNDDEDVNNNDDEDVNNNDDGDINPGEGNQDTGEGDHQQNTPTIILSVTPTLPENDDDGHGW